MTKNKKFFSFDRIRHLWIWIPLLIYFSLHLPFLTSDPDTLVDVHTRGAWTDEGLYSAQARNFINTGVVNIKEESSVIRGPLYFVLQIPFFIVFGQSLIVARMIVLGSVLFLFWFMLKRKITRNIAIFLLATGFTQYHLFHFSHYAMSEMLVIVIIILASTVLAKAYHPHQKFRKSLKYLFISSSLLFFAYGLKIQFLYIAALIPLFSFVMTVTKITKSKAEFHADLKKLFFAILFTAGFFLIYVLSWYLPNIDFYNHVILRETSSRYPETLLNILSAADFNFSVILFVPFLKPLLIYGAVAFIAGITLLIIKPSNYNNTCKLIFVVALLWVILELHKVPMTYLPHRYMLSAYAAVALLISASFAMIYQSAKKIRPAIAAATFLIIGLQTHFIYDASQNRTYDLNTVNVYLKQYDWDGEVIAGTWAPSVTWGTKARTFPVWADFINYEPLLNSKMIITESDQEDSGESFIKQGIQLEEEADSARIFEVWRYKIYLYWVKSVEDDQ